MKSNINRLGRYTNNRTSISRSSRALEFNQKDDVVVKLEVLNELCHETEKSQNEFKRVQEKIKLLELAQQELELLKEVDALERGLKEL